MKVIIDGVDYYPENGITPSHIGNLISQQGINGFKIAEVGTPVFEFGDRYFIHLETLDGKSVHVVKYLKPNLKKQIEFI